MRRLLFALIAFVALSSAAEDRLVFADTRPGIRVGYWLMVRPGATATVMLLPGGEGGIGSVKGQEPRSKNFLVRTREMFAAAGFNVAVIGKPSDKEDMDLAFRAGKARRGPARDRREPTHDARQAVWLVGTSRGSVSAAAAGAARSADDRRHRRLTSSVTYSRAGPSVPTLALMDVRVPALVMHLSATRARIAIARGAPHHGTAHRRAGQEAVARGWRRRPRVPCASRCTTTATSAWKPRP
jgi:hypothetical protein